MPKKLTPRQLAGRKARAAWKGFTPEGLQKLRAAALEHRPWEKATGPRSPRGKARARRNAIRNGSKLVGLMPKDQAELLAAIAVAEATGCPVPSCEAASAMLLAGVEASQARGEDWRFYSAIRVYARWQDAWRRQLRG